MSLTTAATDSPALTAGNDTITAGTDALNTGDLVIDQQTTDSDVLTAVIGSGNDNQAPTIRKIETVNLDFKGFGLTFDAANTQDATIALSTSQTGNSAAIVTGVGNKNVNFTPAASIKTLTLGGTAATTDATTVKLAGNALALDIGGNNTQSVDLVTLNSTTGANTVTLSDTKGDFAATTSKLILTGDKDITVKTTDTILDKATITNSLTAGAKATLELTTVAGKDLSYADSSVGIKIAAAGAGNVVVTKGATVDLAVADALTAATDINTAVKGTGTDGTLDLIINKADQSTILTGANVKNLNLTANVADSKIDTKLDTDNAKATVNVLGTNALTIADWNAEDKSTLNASGATGKLTVSKVTLKAGAVDGVVILGGAGGMDVVGSAKVDTIVGGDAADTITATTGADSVTGGAGADVFVFDTAKSITTGSAYTTITDFAKGTDKLVLTGASDGAVDLTSITPTSGIYTFGTDTKFYINLQNDGSGLTATSLADSVQLGSATVVFTGTNITGGNFDDNIETTVTSGATLKGGAGNDSITGAAGADTITGGTGIDFITLGNDSTTKVADVVKFAKGDSASVTAVADAMSVANFDAVVGVIADATSPDVIDLSAVIGSATYTGHTTGAVTVLTDFTTVNLTTDNKFYVVQGTITVGKFSANNTGDDYLVIYDADSTSAVSYEGISLVGVFGTPAITYADGKLSIGV